MPKNEGQEKTEKATQKKLDDSRKKGQVAKSIEIGSFAIFTGGLLLLFLTQKVFSSKISEFSINIFNSLNTLTISKISVQTFLTSVFVTFFSIVGPFMAVLVAIAMIASFAQVGFKISPEALIPKFDKLNPLSGIKNVFFSAKSFVEVVKSLLKLLVVGGFTYLVISDFIVSSTQLPGLSVSEIVNFMLKAAYGLLIKIAIVYAAIAAIDFVYQRYKFNKDMRMTKQEVKEENKQTEGDPLIKSRIKRLQYQRARSRMMAEVPKADVIITNPTHYAIAIKYNMKQDSAPKVIAKGVDEVAQRIKAIAAEHNVPMHENKELARALYKTCDIGEHIPSTLFHAVAKILAYVYKLKMNKNGRSIV